MCLLHIVMMMIHLMSPKSIVQSLVQPKGTPPLIGYKRQRSKAIVLRVERPNDIASDAIGADDDDNSADKSAGMDQPPNPKRQKTVGNEGRRNRASPARLFKLNKELISAQKGVIIGKEFGGLLDLAANSMPRDLSQWIMRHYDPEMSQIVILERGKIPVDATSIRRIWGLPNRGRKVCFDTRSDITREMYSIYNITSKYSPTLTAWCKMIKDMNGAHDDRLPPCLASTCFFMFPCPINKFKRFPKKFP